MSRSLASQPAGLLCKLWICKCPQFHDEFSCSLSPFLSPSLTPSLLPSPPLPSLSTCMNGEREKYAWLLVVFLRRNLANTPS